MRARGGAAMMAAVVLAASMAVGAPASAEDRALPAVTADYRFSGNLTSSRGEAPDLRNMNEVGRNRFRTEGSGATARRVLTFPDGNGLRLRNATSVVKRGVYTMAITVRFDSVDGYTRIVNFAGDGADTGLYTYNGALWLYNTSSEALPTVEPGEWVTIVVTRNGKGLVRGYVDGVLQFEIGDSAERYAVVSEANELWFFRDNANREENAGAVDRIRLWDTPLSKAQVAALAP